MSELESGGDSDASIVSGTEGSDTGAGGNKKTEKKTLLLPAERGKEKEVEKKQKPKKEVKQKKKKTWMLTILLYQVNICYYNFLLHQFFLIH